MLTDCPQSVPAIDPGSGPLCSLPLPELPLHPFGDFSCFHTQTSHDLIIAVQSCLQTGTTVQALLKTYGHEIEFYGCMLACVQRVKLHCQGR